VVSLRDENMKGGTDTTCLYYEGTIKFCELESLGDSPEEGEISEKSRFAIEDSDV
jgi:hypothetical protein